MIIDRRQYVDKNRINFLFLFMREKIKFTANPIINNLIKIYFVKAKSIYSDGIKLINIITPDSK